jgi:uncharacterized protein YjbJ (UPF0337 family)
MSVCRPIYSPFFAAGLDRSGCWRSVKVRKDRKVRIAVRSIVEIRYQETIMNKDQIKGRIKEAKGKVKEVTGKIVSNKTLEEKGKIQTTIGKVQARYGDLKDDLKKGG